MKITKIVITGGPCAGKTTAMSWIQNAFTQKSCHAHFRCNNCGKIIDLKMKKDFISLVEGGEGYKITDAQLYLKGLCPNCIKK